MIKAINMTVADCEKYLRKMSAVGFDGIDLSFWYGFMEDGWERRVEHVAKMLEENNMVCHQVHLPSYDLFASSELYNDKIEEQIKNSFKAMSMLGAKWGALHPQSSTGFDYDRGRAMHDNREKIKGYLEAASKYDVGIAVENIPIFPDCPQYKFFSAHPEDHLELVDSLNSDLVGICWDFGHANLMDYDMCDVLKMMGKRIKILHVHNNNTQCDWHVTPSIGTIKWDGVADAMREFGYDGALSMELNFKLIPEERMDSYIKYIGEDAAWLEKKLEK